MSDLTDRANWRPIERARGFAWRSACGRWQICRTGLAGSVHERFSLWALEVATPDPAQPSGKTALVSVEQTALAARRVAAGALLPISERGKGAK